jgi:hypothetical protein
MESPGFHGIPSRRLHAERYAGLATAAAAFWRNRAPWRLSRRRTASERWPVCGARPGPPNDRLRAPARVGESRRCSGRGPAPWWVVHSDHDQVTTC